GVPAGSLPGGAPPKRQLRPGPTVAAATAGPAAEVSIRRRMLDGRPGAVSTTSASRAPDRTGQQRPTLRPRRSSTPTGSELLSKTAGGPDWLAVVCPRYRGPQGPCRSQDRSGTVHWARHRAGSAHAAFA